MPIGLEQSAGIRDFLEQPVIDLPPQGTAAVTITRSLSECGLATGTFTANYQSELQNIEIVVARRAEVTPEQFACIQRASKTAIVTFEDPVTAQAYSKFETALYRPWMIAEATREVERLGLLPGFPRRASYPNMTAYAAALEKRGGVPVGSALKVTSGEILFDPVQKPDIRQFDRKYTKLFAVLMYAMAIDDVNTLGFLGNEQIVQPSDPVER